MGHAHSTQSSRPRHPGPSYNHYSFYYPRLKYNKSIDPLSLSRKEISDSDTTDSDTESDTISLKAPPKQPPPLVNQYSLYYPRVKYDPSSDPLDATKGADSILAKPTVYMTRIVEADATSDHNEANRDRPKGSNQPKDHQALTAMVAGYTGAVAKSDHHHDSNHQPPGASRHHEHHEQGQQGEPGEQHSQVHDGSLAPGAESHGTAESHAVNVAHEDHGGDDYTAEEGVADGGGDDGDADGGAF